MQKDHGYFMNLAIQLALEGMERNEGGPFGAVVVKDGAVVGRGNNKVTSGCDPTAHAEIVAIRDACKKLKHFQLDDCIIYSSCEPCPMCFGAIYWARPKALYFACSHKDATDHGFDDSFIYEELKKMIPDRSIPTYQFMRKEGIRAFKIWESKEHRTEY